MSADKNRAFANALRVVAEANGTIDNASKFITQAERGRYSRGGIRPAFLHDHFGITEQQWDAIWALTYG